MKDYKVLVTGVGAIIGYGVVNSLRKSCYNTYIVGIDIYDDAVGQYWCDTFVQAIPSKDSLYINFIFNLIKKHDIDLVIFGTEQEMHKISENISLKNWGKCKFVLNRKEVIALSEDKWETFRYLRNNRLLAIDSMITCNFEQAKEKWGVPFLLKPRRSYASKGIVKINNKTEFEFYKRAAAANFMVQEIVGDNDHEYTAGIFGFGNGEYIGPIIFERTLSGEGATAKAKVVDIPQLTEEIDTLTKLLRPDGPTNYQFRLSKGQYLLLEINPRISSSTSLRTVFGFNEAEMCITYYLRDEKIVPPQIKFGSASRYVADWVTYK